MKKNVLVFPCGTEIGLEVLRSLEFSTHFKVFGGNSVDDHAKFVCVNYIDGIPLVDAPEFIGKINKVIDEYNIDFIVPAHDNVLLSLAKQEAKGNLHCKLITSPLWTCEIANSKLRTYEFFENKGFIRTPKVYAGLHEVADANLPIFLKPEVGNGSRGTQTAKTREDIEFYIENDPSLLLLEYLPGPEYTIDCFTNKNGKLLFCEPRVRQRIANGISVNSATVDVPLLKEIAERINQHLAFRGVWFFQMKEKKGELVLMEVAPRVAGTMGLVRCKGVNLVLLSLFDAMGCDVDVFQNNCTMVIDRALHNRYQHDIKYRHVYLDFDDLVIFDGKVNPAVMAFVYQCFNRGVEVHLLTKHKEDLHKQLKKYRLTDVFDELIHIGGNEDKHMHIKHKDAIFIDDSYAERKRIHDEHQIPVFDAHMIESLI